VYCCGIINSALFYNLLISVTILISLVSPVIWKTDFGNFLPIFLADYFNPGHGSFFPLFPWLFFLFSGAVFSRFYTNARIKSREDGFIRKLFFYSLIPIFLGHFFLSGLFNSWVFSIRPNLLFLYQRLGYILILASFFWYYAYKRETNKSFVLDVSRESLLIYWLHLEIIYSKIWNGKSISDIIGGVATPTECLAATLILIFLMVLVAKLWGGFKTKFPVHVRPVTSSIIVIAILLFLLI
jgi:hypothetical protein